MLTIAHHVPAPYCALNTEIYKVHYLHKWRQYLDIHTATMHLVDAKNNLCCGACYTHMINSRKYSKILSMEQQWNSLNPADMNQEIDCGLMVGSHFDVQELQKQNWKGIKFQSWTKNSELVFSANCGLWCRSKEKASIHNLAAKGGKNAVTLFLWRNQIKWRTFCSLLFDI